SLYIAARNGHVEVVKLVAMHDESLVTARDEYDNSVLDAAARWGNANIIRLLLEKGAPPNADDGGAISSACSVGAHAAVRLLVHAGSNVDTTNTAGWTPLHKAIDKDKLDIARFLLKRGANANANDNALNTGAPLHLACSKASPAAVRLLVD
ncbi:ankyrin, partial [Alternaria alternata]